MASTLVANLSKAIMLWEGFTKPHSIPWTNNNPLDLNEGPRMTGRDSKGHAVYAKVSDGWQDGEELIARIINTHTGITLYTFFAGQRDSTGKVVPGGYSGYAPEADPRGGNDPSQYATGVSKLLNIQLNQPLKELL